MRYDFLFFVNFLYLSLIILNVLAFKILEKHGRKYWKYESVPFQRFLLKKLGIIPWAIISFLIFCFVFLLLFFSADVPDLVIGFVYGVLSFNIIADFWNFSAIIEQIEKEDKSCLQ